MYKPACEPRPHVATWRITQRLPATCTLLWSCQGLPTSQDPDLSVHVSASQFIFADLYRIGLLSSAIISTSTTYYLQTLWACPVEEAALEEVEVDLAVEEASVVATTATTITAAGETRKDLFKKVDGEWRRDNLARQPS